MCRFFSLDLSHVSKGLQTFTFIVRQLRADSPYAKYRRDKMIPPHPTLGIPHVRAFRQHRHVSQIGGEDFAISAEVILP